MVGRARGGAATGSVLPCRLHPSGTDRRHRLSEQAGDLRSAVQGGCRHDHGDRRRPQASRRTHRPHRRAAHLGFGDDPSPPRAPDRAGWRSFRGSIALGAVPAVCTFLVFVSAPTVYFGASRHERPSAEGFRWSELDADGAVRNAMLKMSVSDSSKALPKLFSDSVGGGPSVRLSAVVDAAPPVSEVDQPLTRRTNAW